MDEEGTRFLQLIADSSKRMGQLLGDLLAYSQASSITDELPEPIPAVKPLEVALGNLAVSLRETDARITVGDLPTVRVRETHLAQWFQNLIGNALKYGRDNVTPELSVGSQRLGDRRVSVLAITGSE